MTCRGTDLAGPCEEWCDWDEETLFYDFCRVICDYDKRSCPDNRCAGFVESCMPPPSSPTLGPGGGLTDGVTVTLTVLGTGCLLSVLLTLLYCCCGKRIMSFIRPLWRRLVCRNDHEEAQQPFLLPSVENLVATVDDRNNVTIEFSDPSKRATHFELAVGQIAGDGAVVDNSVHDARVAALADGGPMSHHLPALPPGTRYRVSVTPVRDIAVQMNGVANGHAGGRRRQGHRRQGHRDQGQGQGQAAEGTVSREFFTKPPVPTGIAIVAYASTMTVRCSPLVCAYGANHRPDVWVRVTRDGGEPEEPMPIQLSEELMEGVVQGLTPSTLYTVLVFATIRQLDTEPEILLRTDAAETRQERTLIEAQAVTDDAAAEPILHDPEDPSAYRLAGIDHIQTDAEALAYARRNPGAMASGNGSRSPVSDEAVPQNVLDMGAHSETYSEGPQPQI